MKRITKMRIIGKIGAAAAALLLWTTGCSTVPEAETFTLDGLFQDHMVVQRNRPVPVFGTAAPGRLVRVNLGDAIAEAVADSTGRWHTEFAPLPAGGPYTLVVSGDSAATPVVRNDILCGELWMCSGQSNMEWPLNRVLNAPAVVAAAHDPMLRLFKMPKRNSPSVPRSDLGGGKWTLCNPGTVGTFSGVGYFFGKTLRDRLKVPVGLVDASVGGSRIEAWMGPRAFMESRRPAALFAHRYFQLSPEERARATEREKIRAGREFDAWLELVENTHALEIARGAAWSRQGADTTEWEKTTLPCRLPAYFDGAMLFRLDPGIPADWAEQDLELSLGVIDDCDEVSFNGRAVGATQPGVPGYYAKKRVYKIPGSIVQTEENILAVRVIDHIGSGGFMSPAKEIFLRRADGKGPVIPLAGPRAVWVMRPEFQIDLSVLPARPELFTAPESMKNSINYPGTFRCGMLAPWFRLPFGGVIWYQGCSNLGDARSYAAMEKAFIRELRAEWQNPDLPFITAQLSALGSDRRGLVNDLWPQLREAQEATLKLPRTGMAVTLDVGDPRDIHPRDKATVGVRLAAEAIRLIDGDGIGASAGPVYNRMTREGSKIRLHFRNANLGLAAKGGKPAGFSIAGADGVFHVADARIEGETVVVSSPEVPAPRCVRYAWTDFPGTANLYNTEGFPAGSFRTDPPDYIRRF